MMGSPVSRSSRVNKTWYSLPVHCLTAEDLQHENSKRVNPHFYAPENQHNRFSASLTTQQRAILRNVERPLPYNTKQQQQQRWETGRPGTAPAAYSMRESSASTAQQQSLHAGSLHSSSAHHMGKGAHALTKQAMLAATQKGVPCYSMEAVVAADIIEGRPASGREESWRVARVKSYAVPTSKYGYGEAGSQAFHQKYGWYKFNGFAGKGAKTSWGGNPSKCISR